MSDKYEIYQQYRKTLLDTPVENHELYKDLIDEFDFLIDYIKNSMTFFKFESPLPGRLALESKHFRLVFAPIIKDKNKYAGINAFLLSHCSNRNDGEFIPIFEIDSCDEFEKDLKELGEEIEIKYLYMKSFMDYVMSDLVQIRQEPVFYVRKEIGVGRRWIYV